MKKIGIYSLLVVIGAFLGGCAAKIQTYDLEEEYATSLHYEGSAAGGEEEKDETESLVGIPAKSYYGGDLKRGAIWWTGKGMTLQKGTVFTISATNVGPDTSAFGATFPPLDLVVEKVFIRISARAESEGEAPVVYMQVDDASGYKANAKRPYQTIEKSGEFKDYYFDARDIFQQSTPKKHKVNGAMINSLKFFINPGQAGYTGKIYIQEIKVVPASSVEGIK